RHRPGTDRDRSGLRHPPRPDADVLRHEREVTLFEPLQAALDRTLHAPLWVGYGLIALAAAITIPGRHGQRLLNAAGLGGSGAWLVFWGLRGLHPWLPGIAAIVAAVLLALFGLVAVGWATAFLLGVIFALAGALAAHLLHLLIAPIAVMFLGLGLYAG